MNIQNTLNDEKIILSFANNSLVLTNQRVKYESVSASNSIYKSIPLDKVSICKLDTKTYPVLLILSAIAFLFMFVGADTGQQIGAFIAAVVFLLAYFSSKKSEIGIFSDSGESIGITAKGLKYEDVRKFLEAISQQYHSNIDRSDVA